MTWIDWLVLALAFVVNCIWTAACVSTGLRRRIDYTENTDIATVMATMNEQELKQLADRVYEKRHGPQA